MKHLFFFICPLIALVCASCSSDDAGNDTSADVDALSETMASVETQIASINASLKHLTSVDEGLTTLISLLQDNGEKYAGQIAVLQQMDQTVDGQITSLRNYIQTGIRQTEDWTSATFATLARFDSLSRVVAAVPLQLSALSDSLDEAQKALIQGYTDAIGAAVTSLDISMQRWVNTRLTGYCTLARMDAALDSLAKSIHEADAALLEQVEAQQTALAAARIEITAAYQQAIREAIETLEGTINKKIADDIEVARTVLQGQIDRILEETASLRSRLDRAETTIAHLLRRIQSIELVPDFTDGSVVVTDWVDVLSFDLQPEATADSLARLWQAADRSVRERMFSFSIKGVQTKTLAQDAPSATIDTVYFSDGELKMNVRFARLPENAVASLHVQSGDIHFGTRYFELVKVEDYVCFTAVDGPVTIGMVSSAETSDVHLEYSKNGVSWVPFEVGITTATLSRPGNKIFFRADPDNPNTRLSGQYRYHCFTATGAGKVNVSGNVMRLLNSAAPAVQLLPASAYAFGSLFLDMDRLLDASGLKLSAEILSEGCYANMFQGCTSLTATPELPAKTLSTKCYYGMFQGCTSLVSAPVPAASAMAENCCASMFAGCASLQYAILPAETLAEGCYSSMFKGCSSLVTAPALPAEKLETICYYGMFEACTSLVDAPALPAETLDMYCYARMFRGCTSLVEAPVLPAAHLVQACYNNMFYGCSKLSVVTMLAEDVSASGCLQGWLSQAGTTSSSRNLYVLSSMVRHATVGDNQGIFVIQPYM